MKVEITVERTVRQVATVELNADEDTDQWTLFDEAAAEADNKDLWQDKETQVSKTRSVCRIIDDSLEAWPGFTAEQTRATRLSAERAAHWLREGQ